MSALGFVPTAAVFFFVFVVLLFVFDVFSLNEIGSAICFLALGFVPTAAVFFGVLLLVFVIWFLFFVLFIRGS